MSNNKTVANIETPSIEWFDAKGLTVEKGFNPREEKSFTANIKELAALIQAHGGIDPSIHCVSYIERDGKKLIRNGHTLHAVATQLKMKVPAVKTTMDETKAIVYTIVSNAGHPLTHFEQGKQYVKLRDGLDASKVAVGEEVRAPMVVAEIGRLVGFSGVHVANCIAIFESPDDVREFLEAGKISANAYIEAKKNLKDGKKVMAILKAAIKVALEENKETATDKHVKQVKPQFVEPKLKAGKTEATPPETFKAKSETPASNGLSGLGGSEKPEDEPEQSSFTTESEQPSQPDKTDKKAEMRDKIAGIIHKGIEDGDSETEIADKIISELIPF